MVELWLRPWALARRDRRCPFPSEKGVVSADNRGALWIYIPNNTALQIDNSAGGAELVVGFSLDGEPRRLLQLPAPLSRTKGTKIKCGLDDATLLWPHIPDRPLTHEPQSPEEKASHFLLLHARAVWDRLRDVDTALADPANLWEELRRRWTGADDFEPHMDVIVSQARALARTINELDRVPRRILRRTHQHIPISRVQEIDRRSMAWLVRQPGETLAERAGDRQKILAVAREQNFDTLENRVLRAYGELARHVARDYCSRNNRSKHTPRYRIVEAFGNRCHRLSRDLSEKGVRIAEPGVTPNFVLQQNPQYQRSWAGWNELLNERKRIDDLWKWQARSWEEFCALVIMVSLISVPGAQVVASSPLVFRDDQRRGSWVEHENPLGVFYLPTQGIVVNVRYRMESPGSHLADFGACLWIDVRKINRALDNPVYIAVWPIWDAIGGLDSGEVSEISGVLKSSPKSNVRAGLVIRPAMDEGFSIETGSSALSVTLGTQGEALWKSVASLSEFLSSVLLREAK